jgi:hypothetical protein
MIGITTGKDTGRFDKEKNIMFGKDKVTKDVTQLSARELEKVKKDYKKQFIKLSVPCLTETIRLVDVVESVANSSWERYENHRRAYPFYDVRPDAPAFHVLAQLLYFLSQYAHDQDLADEGLNLWDWEDGGPLRLRKIAGFISVDYSEYKGLQPSEAEYSEAFAAYREMLKGWGEDCKPLFTPIEKYISLNLDIQKKRLALIDETQKKFRGTFVSIDRGFDGYGAASRISNVILGNPYAKDVLIADKRDVGFWARAGQPKIEIENKKFIKVRDRFGEKWLTPDQFREFIK